MVIALALMSRVLWPGKHIGEQPSTQHRVLIQSKRKVVYMLSCGKHLKYKKIIIIIIN